jgi:hypothetical protein
MRPATGSSLAVALLASSLLVAPARGQNPPPREPAPSLAASSFATVEVHLNSRRIGGRWYAEDAGFTGPARIAIAYGQPHARGRRIEGGLIPDDSVWRFGANAATSLHTDVDLTLGTLRIPQGDYSLFVRHAAGGWELIVNSASAAWGTDRDPSRDLGRTALTARTRSEPEESLSVYLVPDARDPGTGQADLRGRLRIVWGRTELTAPWSVAP